MGIVEIESDEDLRPEESIRTQTNKLEKRIKKRHAVKTKRRLTILEQEEEIADMLFQGLDIDNSGTINPNQVRWMDRWNATKKKPKRRRGKSCSRLARVAARKIEMRTAARRSRMRPRNLERLLSKLKNV